MGEKLNATMRLINIVIDHSSAKNYERSIKQKVDELITTEKIDFYINAVVSKDLQSYNFVEFCSLVPLPPKYSIYELILILPLDKSCWMWLGITVVVCAVIWKMFERSKTGSGFLFGIFAFFVGQSAEIKT